MANTGTGEGGGGRRDPKDMAGLLKFCTEATRGEDAKSDRVVAPLSPEKRKFLEDVFSSLQDNDPVKVMLEDINILLSEDEDVGRKEGALEDIQLHCEDLDLANDFMKMGGPDLLNRLLLNNHSGYRWRAAEVVGTLAQNNPYSQQGLLDTEHLMKNLINVLETDDNDTCRVKALYGISCMTRNFSAAQDMFVSQYDGFSVLVRALQTNIEKLHIKVSFMMAALCQENSKYQSTLVNMGLLDQLVALIHTPHAAHHEHLIRALLVLVESSSEAQAECRRPELNLKSVLEERVKLLQGHEEYQEELEYATKLQAICFHGNSGDVER